MDILFKNDDFVFSYRVGGILKHNGKILLQRPKNDDYAIIGGHVAAMETSMETLKREFEEELHAKIEVDNLLAIGEIYFPWVKYMERRGSGLRKIVSETEKLPGYTEAYKPEFSSTATDFRVILKNVNYHHDYSIMDINQVKTQVKTQVTTFDEILVFCSIPHSKAEIADYCGYKNNKNFTKKYLRPLLDSGTLKMTIPNKPNSRNQKYITVRTE